MERSKSTFGRAVTPHLENRVNVHIDSFLWDSAVAVAA